MGATASDEFFQGLPKGRARLRWFLRHVEVQAGFVDPGISPGTMRDLKTWFSDHRDEFLYWTNSDEFRGEDFSSGFWSVDPEELRTSVPKALREIALKNLGGVDQWLALFEAGALPSAEVEPGFAGLRLTPAQRSRCFDARNRVRAGWPRNCRTCGCEFKPTMKTVKSCAPCRAKRREETEARSTRGSGKAKA